MPSASSYRPQENASKFVTSEPCLPCNRAPFFAERWWPPASDPYPSTKSCGRGRAPTPRDRPAIPFRVFPSLFASPRGRKQPQDRSASDQTRGNQGPPGQRVRSSGARRIRILRRSTLVGRRGTRDIPGSHGKEIVRTGRSSPPAANRGNDGQQPLRTASNVSPTHEIETLASLRASSWDRGTRTLRCSTTCHLSQAARAQQKGTRTCWMWAANRRSAWEYGSSARDP